MTNMVYTCKYQSPLGDILLAADEIGLTGLWFEGQKYFANTLPACLLRQLAVRSDIMKFPLSFPATGS